MPRPHSGLLLAAGLAAGCAGADGEVARDVARPTVSASPTTSASSTPTSPPAPSTSTPSTSPTTTLAPTTTTTVARATTTTTPPPPPGVQLTVLPAGASVVEADDPAALALATSAALFERSSAVVVAPAASAEDTAAGAAAAETLGVPLLLATDDNTPLLVAEVGRLGAHWIVAVGSIPAGTMDGLPSDVVVVADAAAIAPMARAAPWAGVAAVVRRDDPNLLAAAATLRAAGIPAVAVDGGDPRVAGDSREALRALAPSAVVAIGTTGTFPAPPVLHGLVETVLAGHELPGGGQVVFPGRRLVALYGHPGDPNLGVLGEQPVEAAVERARQVAAEYAASDVPAVPTFEIITTVASSAPGPDGDYSLESDVEQIRPWIDAAGDAGLYAVIELQPGYTDFLTQAQRYEELLARPHVGLALDPEWRLAPGERHLQDVGQVSAEEVNRVATWLAELTRRHALPQKLLLLQQFRLDMLPDREDVAIHPELALVVQMDGFGPQPVKLNTWRAITSGGPFGIRFGWKQFYDEDRPVRSPVDTMALEPAPMFISYQ